MANIYDPMASFDENDPRRYDWWRNYLAWDARSKIWGFAWLLLIGAIFILANLLEKIS